MAPSPIKQQPPPAADGVPATNASGTSEVFEYTPPPYFAASSRVPNWLQPWLADAFIFVMIHYNLWMGPVLAFFYFLYQIGYGLVVVAIVALYIPSFIDGAEFSAHGRPWEWLWGSHLWRLFSHYMRVKVIREQELQPEKQYIFGLHPHGIIVLSRVAYLGGSWEKLFPKIAARLLGATAVFKIPLARELGLWLNGVDASRSTAEKVLKAGNSVLVYPGGVSEIFLTEPESKETKIVLKSRLGFVKMAIRHGAELVPVFVFGEKWLYNVWTPPKSIVALVKKTLKIPIILFWGRFLWLPKQLPQEKSYGVVYGKPIPTTQNAEPSDEEIRAIHAQYMAEIERLFEQYKLRFGYEADEILAVI